MISAILLAAGKSTRMINENKLSKNYDGIPLIKHSVKNILSSNINELIIVLGYQNETIKSLIDYDRKIKFIYNKEFENGMASSIKAGIKNLSEKTQAFFICLGDMPFVSKDVYNKLIKSKKNEKIIAPIFESRRGHPVLFDISMKNEIMLISGDVGAKEILKKNKDKIFNLEINDQGIIQDFNTQDNFIS